MIARDIDSETIRRAQAVNRLHDLIKRFGADEVEELNEAVEQGRWRKR